MVLDNLFTSYTGGGAFRDCMIVDWVYETLNDDLESLYGKKYSKF